MSQSPPQAIHQRHKKVKKLPVEHGSATARKIPEIKSTEKSVVRK
jgi:hypothetical protein